MQINDSHPDDEGLRFFGRISASISHDLKNELAVINENAGLLKDLTLMSAKGAPLNPERVQKIADKVQERVRKADTIIRNMNMFAHSVDQPEAVIDIGESLTLFNALTLRLTAMRGVSVNFRKPDVPLKAETSPFFFLVFCYQCLSVMMNALAGERAITIEMEEKNKSMQIHFLGICDEELLSQALSETGVLFDEPPMNAEITKNIKKDALTLMIKTEA